MLDETTRYADFTAQMLDTVTVTAYKTAAMIQTGWLYLLPMTPSHILRQNQIMEPETAYFTNLSKQNNIVEFDKEMEIPCRFFMGLRIRRALVMQPYADTVNGKPVYYYGQMLSQKYPFGVFLLLCMLLIRMDANHCTLPMWI
jgi:hypothetical protein